MSQQKLINSRLRRCAGVAFIVCPARHMPTSFDNEVNFPVISWLGVWRQIMCFDPHLDCKTAASYPHVSLLMKMCAQRKAGRRKQARRLADLVFKIAARVMADQYAIFKISSARFICEFWANPCLSTSCVWRGSCFHPTHWTQAS